MQYEQLEIQRFIKRHGITNFQFNPNFPVNTLALMRMAVAADMAGNLRAYADAVFHHMWEAPKKMDDPEVIRAALTESGLDADALIAAAQTPEVKQRLMNNTEAAVERGTFGSPTFFVGNEMFFGKDTPARRRRGNRPLNAVNIGGGSAEREQGQRDHHEDQQPAKHGRSLLTRPTSGKLGAAPRRNLARIARILCPAGGRGVASLLCSGAACPLKAGIL